jgi:hypothetical protein
MDNGKWKMEIKFAIFQLFHSYLLRNKVNFLTTQIFPAITKINSLIKSVNFL